MRDLRVLGLVVFFIPNSGKDEAFASDCVQRRTIDVSVKEL